MNLVPKSGAEYAYLFETFAKLHKFWGPLPAFICNWIYVMVLRPAEVAILSLICVTYGIEPIGNFIGLDNLDESHKQQIYKILAVLLLGKTLCSLFFFFNSKINFNFFSSNRLGIVTYINLKSVKLFVAINNFCSIGKVVACVVVILGGVYQLCLGNTKNLSSGFEGTTTNPGHIALAFYNGLWAYDGWVSVTLVTEEIKRPEK